MAFGIQADLILINGRIWRGREEGISEALAVWQGKVLATGSDADILGLKGPRTEVIDLEGRFATPASSTTTCTSSRPAWPWAGSTLRPRARQRSPP